MTTLQHPTTRLFAVLPTGTYFEPGRSCGCPGPDAYGACPLGGPVADRPCAGATWHYGGPHGWRFVFHAGSSVCPVAVLDPLGPTPVPLD